MVSQSRSPAVPQSRRLVVSLSRCLAVSLARVPVILSRSQSFSAIPSYSRATTLPSARPLKTTGTNPFWSAPVAYRYCRSLFTYLGTTLLLQLRLQVAHRALNLLVGKCLILIFQDEAECIRLLALGQLIALVNVEQRYRFK